MCPLECIWIDGMVYLWLRPPFWQTMAVIEMSFCSNRISTTKNSRCHTLHRVQNWGPFQPSKNRPKNWSKILSLMNQNRAFFGQFSSTIGITRKIVLEKNVCRVMGWGRESHSQHDITLEGAHVCMWCRCDANQSKTMIVHGTDITRADIGLHVLVWCVYYNDIVVFACWRASC
jgi:hypothetical protein